MPRRADLESICLIGSGPIVIGQAAEFDYAGTQALKVLREDGFRTIVVNSNPATIMTDPGFADRTYLEPLDLDGVASVLARERPDALLPTMGGQTALNLARELAERGTLAELGIELIGAPVDVIARAEDRELFREAVQSVGLRVPSSRVVTDVAQLAGLSTPAVVRPAFTLGGHGGGFVETAAELRRQVERGLAESPISQVLVEESVRGWDEFELEVVRDRADNVVIVCSIENLDPMGVHTGDLRVIEMNPRVSRSSALASKATGYPIAKVAAKLAVGYTLDEIPNDLTRTTPASFEPTLDYVVVKFPRFAFSDAEIADWCDATEDVVRAKRRSCGVRPSYRRVDSCAGEVAAESSYYYSTYGEADEFSRSTDKPRVVILGSGPNRIGQGIEFDYCCVHAAQSFRALVFETVMVNCNPET